MKNANWKWLYAKLRLGFLGALHYALMFWPWRSRFGYQKFLENYLPDGLPSYSPELRAIAHEPGRCTTCGMCDAACPEISPFEKGGPRGIFLGPMRLVISGMRGGPILPDVADSLAFVANTACQGCQACERACPEQIPIVSLAQQFHTQLKQLQT